MTWTSLDKTWHDTTVDYCDVCGNLLINQYWSFDDPEGRPVRACREDDERLLQKLRRYRAEREATYGRTR